MEKEVIVPTAGKEMNFWDLCVTIGRGIGLGCMAAWRILSRMIRLTYRYWYIVVTLVVLAVAVAVYHTRPDNITYRVNAVAMINGASLQQFEQAFAPLQTGQLLPENTLVKHYMKEKLAQNFELFRVVDVHHDGTPDFIDFKRKSNPKDTLEVQMQDRVCIQFRTKAHSVHLIPDMEEALLALLNGNEALQQAYEVYLPNLREEVAFNHRQAVKLDSLTSAYYYNAGATTTTMSNDGSSVNFYGDRRIRLFLNEIYKQQQHTRNGDLRLLLASAPVVFENHFSVDPAPVITRTKCMILFFLFGWIMGCVIAELIDKRKELIAWLKQ